MFSRFTKAISFLQSLSIVLLAGGAVTGLIVLSIREGELFLPVLQVAARIFGGLLVGTGGLFMLHEIRSIIVTGHLSADAAGGASFSIAVGVLLLHV